MLDNELSRRQMLVRTAATAAGLSLSLQVLAARKAHAAINPPVNPAADNALLNVLLTFEFNAIATYTAGVGIIDADAAADAATKSTVKAVAQHFQAQHVEHAAALRALIVANGGTPTTTAPPATPSLPAGFVAAPKTVGNVLKLATDAEKHAAASYANVMKTISTQAAAKLVAAIGGVETQHFIVLYLLVEGLIQATGTTGSSAALVVPASFVVDVGLAGSSNLKDNPTLDTLLAITPNPPLTANAHEKLWRNVRSGR